MTRQSLVLRLAGVAISVVCLVLLVGTIDVAETAAVLGRVNPAPLAFVALVLAAQLSLRAFRWRLLLPVAPGSERPSLVRVLVVLPIGYLGNAVLPARLGEPLRAYILGRREGLDAAGVFGSVVLERVVDTATLAVVACGAAVVAGGPEWLTTGTALVAIACGGGVTAVAVLAIANPRAARQGLAALGNRALGPLWARVEAFGRGFDASRHPERLAVAAGVSAACWALDATTFWLCGLSLGIALSPAAAVLIAGVTVLGTALPSAPGYVGTFELASAGVAGLLGVPAASALALAIVAHALTVLPVALVGAGSLAYLGGNLGDLARRAEAAR